MKFKFLVFLLIFSLVANAYFISFEGQPLIEKIQVQEMQNRINNLQKENEDIQAQINQDNKLQQFYDSQFESYRKKISELENRCKSHTTGLYGFAALQAPAIVQAVQPDSIVAEESAMVNISVEIQLGEGRVLFQTTPLMGVLFQDAGNTAVLVAENKTGKSLSSSDVIFSINAKNQIPRVEGPSAGALMTLITISAIDRNIKLNNSITLTGTIDSKGNIGVIGGVLEKAKAAKAGGKILFLIPKENSKLVTYKYVEKNFGDFTFVERVPEIMNAREYIEKNVGIRTKYVGTIDDVLSYEK
jgi:predicted S18 family serine protease